MSSVPRPGKRKGACAAPFCESCTRALIGLGERPSAGAAGSRGWRSVRGCRRGGGANLQGAVLVEQDDEEVAGLDVEPAARFGLLAGVPTGRFSKLNFSSPYLEAVETGTKTVLRMESSKLWRWISSSCRLKSGLLASGAKTMSMRALFWSWASECRIAGRCRFRAEPRE